MLQNQLQASCIGSMAQHVLRSAGSTSVSNVTSQGIFLFTQTGWVLFVSLKDMPGPLTINVNDPSMSLLDLHPGMIGRVFMDGLQFLEAGITIGCERIPVYFVSPIPEQAVSACPGKARILSILDTWILEGDPLQKSPLLFSFNHVARGIRDYQDKGLQNPTLKFDLFSPALETLIQALGRKELNATGTALISFLGLGRGLTPSGDDLVIGFMLAINRYRSLCQWLGRQEFNRVLVEAAYRMTTRLSANLIECAASGQADERLVIGLDGLVSSHIDPHADLSRLAEWGSSSGLDAWVGMALALLSS